MQKIIPPPPPTTYNGPKPHPFPQQTLSNIYWIAPELQPSLIFLPSKDLQCQIAPHCVAEKEFHSRVLLKSSSLQMYMLGLEEAEMSYR